MGIWDILAAGIKLGVPVAGLSWLLFQRLYSAGEIDRDGDRAALKAGLKELKKAAKKKGATSAGSPLEWGHYLLRKKWFRFGSGFYGTAALWTFMVVEVADLLSFIRDFPGFANLFENGVIAFLVNLLVGQIQNFVTAIVWFDYWPDESQTLFIWLVAAYLGYRVGRNLAQRGNPLSRSETTHE